MSRRDRVAALAGPLVFFTAATAWMTRPFVRQAATHLAETCDSYLNVWILAWGVHAIGTRPKHLFDANIFYPIKNTLALSEHMLGNLPIFAPIALATGDQVLAFNVVILSSFVLCGCTVAWLVRYYTGRIGPGLAAGLVFAFVPFRMTQLPHMQLLSFQFLPVAIYFADRLLREGGWRLWVGFTAFTLWQCLVSYYLAYISVIVLGTYTTVLVWRLRRTLPPRRLAELALALAVVAAVMVPLTLPYRTLQKSGVIPEFTDETFVQEHESLVAMADPIWSYLSLPSDARNVWAGRLATESHVIPWEKHLFPGFIPVLTIVVAAFVRRRDAASRVPTGVVLALAAVLVATYVCALGPWLVWNDVRTSWRMPVYWLGRFVPGFSGIRGWTRFALGEMLALGALFGIALARLTASMSAPVRAAVIGAVLLGVMVEYDVAPIALLEAPEVATPAHRWLAEHGDKGPLLILPGTGIHGCQHAGYMYHTMAHWLPLATGYSGHIPPQAGWVNPISSGLPDLVALAQARRRNLRWLLLQRSMMDPAQLARFDAAVAAGQLTPAATFGDEVIFDLGRRER